MKAVNLLEKFSLFDSKWTPHIVGEMNGQHIKLAKMVDEFVWHKHENEDELFYVVKGTLFIELRDKTIEIKEGEFYIVPKGIEHNPNTRGEEVWVMMIEPASTKHTGTVDHEKTVKDQKWI